MHNSYSTWRMILSQPVADFLKPSLTADDVAAAASFGVRLPGRRIRAEDVAALEGTQTGRYTLRSEMDWSELFAT